MGEVCQKLHTWLTNQRRFVFPFDEKEIPLNGIYVLFEEGEIGHAGRRVVRVGTHTGNNHLCSRLKQHFMTENKDRSIFRKNIGRAILNKNNDPYLDVWELDLTTAKARQDFARKIDLVKQQAIENQISQYIQNNFSFAILPIDDKQQRLSWESKIISTISACSACQPSEKWLGHYSPKEKIRKSGLWLVNELYKQPLLAKELVQLQSLSK